MIQTRDNGLAILKPPVGLRPTELDDLFKAIDGALRSGSDCCIVRTGNPQGREVTTLNGFHFRGQVNELDSNLREYLQPRNSATIFSQPQIKAALARICNGAKIISHLYGTDSILCRANRRTEEFAQVPHVDCAADDFSKIGIEARIFFGQAGTVIYTNSQLDKHRLREYMIGLFCERARLLGLEAPEHLATLSPQERDGLDNFAHAWKAIAARPSIIIPGSIPRQLRWGDIAVIWTGIPNGTLHAAPSIDGHLGEEVRAVPMAVDQSIIVQVAPLNFPPVPAQYLNPKPS